MMRSTVLAFFLACGLPAAASAAPASDFGTGAASCAKLLAADKYDEKMLEGDGWRKSEDRSSVRIYSRDGVAVKLFVSSMFGSNGCIVDGYADKGDRIDDLSAAVAASLKSIAGEELKMPKSPTPNGQGFAFGSVMQILSTEKRPGGLSVRVTGMKM